ncbi:MAG: ComF family protein [Opitutales bacterium]
MTEPLLRHWGRRFLDLVYPRSCEHCGEVVEEGGGWKFLCAGCAARLDWIHPPVCETCGHPFPGIRGGASCEHCEALEPIFAAGRCCVLHREVASTLVRHLKYRHARHLLPDLAHLAGRVPAVVEHVRDAVLVPVPLHPTRLRERGFNQSALLAEAWDRVLPSSGWAELLRRSGWTQTQTRLPREARRTNVRRAFELRPGVEVRPDLTYVVVDDVFTTGSTMNECCRVLRQAGARSLRVLALAHG